MNSIDAGSGNILAASPVDLLLNTIVGDGFDLEVAPIVLGLIPAVRACLISRGRVLWPSSIRLL